MQNPLLEILDNIEVLVYVADLKTHEILFVNGYTKRLFGDIKGKICWQFLQTGQNGPCSFCTNDKIVTAEGKPTGVYHWEFQNAISGKWFDIRDTAIDWEDGRTVRLEVATDITERKKTEIYFKRNAEILEMIATIQPSSSIYNAIALMYESRHPGMRCSMLELKGNKLMHGGAPSLPKEYCDAVNGLENGPCVGSCGTSTYTGKRVLVEDIATDPKWTALKDVALPHGLRSCWSEPIINPAGKILGAFGMYYNHPALPNEEELRDLGSAARLTGIIMESKRARNEKEQLTGELIIKNKELEQVLYVTSHDLRSPLVNVEGYSKELDYSLKKLMSSIENVDVPVSVKGEITPIVKEDIPESLHYIQISVAKMESLLKGILNLSRLGSSELKIEEIDINEMMTDIIDSHSFRLKDLNIKTEISKLPNCRGDSSQINQVFSNLLDNAIKYSVSERSCVINISGYKDKNQSVYCIEDSGLGILPENQDKIFEMFYQLEPDRIKGEGMGLTIARRIIEKHNGKIWVESELGKGSKFFVSIPS